METVDDKIDNLLHSHRIIYTCVNYYKQVNDDL